jgi:hypothetical protein
VPLLIAILVALPEFVVLGLALATVAALVLGVGVLLAITVRLAVLCP